jgi:FkbH-like protein
MKFDSTETTSKQPIEEKKVKCVIWDLDNTCWTGVLLEDRDVVLRPEIASVVGALDSRGILQSVASRNDHDHAYERLTAFGIADYFLYPQINLQPKSVSVRHIAEALGIGTDSIMFVDDDVYEREEVAFSVPGVRTLDARRAPEMLDLPELIPKFVTDEAMKRRELYRSDMVRKGEEASFQGTSEEFLASLGMVMNIRRANLSDLRRAEELTVRTSQLNATGEIYSYDDLDRLRTSPTHLLLIADLNDRFGAYGAIGLALVELHERAWELRLFLMSCRVISRGVGNVMLEHIIGCAHREGKTVKARFAPTDRNRMMYITYKFAGFEEIGSEHGITLLELKEGAARVGEVPIRVVSDL